jgi:geranylgeranyl diphosphate synthase, type I
MKQILSHRAAVRGELERFLRAKHETADPAIGWQADVLDRLLPFATTGKLLRGSLLCYSYEIFSGRDADSTVLKAAAALELTHTALLIHDDIMDNDDTRRGQPSLHAQYRALAQKAGFGEVEHFGASMGMGAGDLTLFLAYELLAGCPTETARLFTEQLAVTAAGQMQDLYLETTPDLPGMEAIYDLMAAKTASYTLALPLLMGASLAEAAGRTRGALRTIGLKAGIIFQIRDDELGVMGDTGQTGKPVGSDIIEGKKTLLYSFLLERCDAAEVKALRRIFGNPEAKPKDIKYVQGLVRRHGVRKLLDDEIYTLQQEALAAVRQLDVTTAHKRELISLIRFCSERHA